MYSGADQDLSEGSIRSLLLGRLSRRGRFAETSADLRVLLLIDLALNSEQIAGLGLDRVVAISFDNLTLRRLASTMPAAVALPLWSPSADAVQILQHLALLGYAGPVHVFGPPLPNRRLVEQELRAVSDQLDVHLAEQPDG